MVLTVYTDVSVMVTRVIVCQENVTVPQDTLASPANNVNNYIHALYTKFSNIYLHVF